MDPQADRATAWISRTVPGSTLGADAKGREDPSDESSAIRIRDRDRDRDRDASPGLDAGLSLHAFIEAIALPAWAFDADRRKVLAVNEALVALTGRTREALLGSGVLDLYDPSDRVTEGLRLELAVRSPNATAAKGKPPAMRLLVKGGPPARVKVSTRPLEAVGRHARLAIAHGTGDEVKIARPRSEPPSREDAPPRTDAWWRALFDLCPAPACVYDLTTLEILAANDAMERLYMFGRDELLQMSVIDLVAPSDVDLVRSIIDAVRRGEWPGVLHHAQTIRHRRKDGEELDTELVAAEVSYAGASARLVLHKDVTEHKRAEEDLVRRARVDALRADLGAAMTTDEPLPAHFERVVQAMKGHLDLDAVGVWLLDEATGQLALQASVGALDATTERGASAAFGETWIGRAAALATPLFLDTSDPSMTSSEIEHARAAGVTHVAALPFVVRRRVLGVVTAGRSSAFPDDLVETLRATAAQIAHAAGAGFAFEALRIAESRSRSILENMPAALITIDQAGLIAGSNASAVATFGYTEEELAGHTFSSLFDARDVSPRILHAHARGRGVDEWKGLRKSGERFPCEVRLFQIDSLRGPGFAAILNDVSERYEMERLKAEFVSAVSHELRTPLTSLRGSIGLLRGGVLGPLPEDVMELLGIAERNSLRLVTLVNDILDLERLHEGKMELFIEPVHASTIVERSLDTVKPLADQAGISIDVRCADELLLGDGDRLVQVLVNLLTNAVKFSPPASRVDVATSVEPDAVLFSVIDRGRGVPASHQRVIFERFEQVYAGDGREKGGTGLGLAISKAIVEQHDGSIGVDSQEGVGSTFWFRVPRALAAPGSVPPASSNPR